MSLPELELWRECFLELGLWLIVGTDLFFEVSLILLDGIKSFFEFVKAAQEELELLAYVISGLLSRLLVKLVSLAC